MQLMIRPDGNIECVYGEDLDLGQLGSLSITRGSHVEPDATGKWFADLSPVSGPTLGPFSNRSEALTAERDWLNEHWLVSR
jgi:hypothetical protein